MCFVIDPNLGNNTWDIIGKFQGHIMQPKAKPETFKRLIEEYERPQK